MTGMFSQIDSPTTVVARARSKFSCRRVLALGLAAASLIPAVRSQGSWTGPYDWSCQLYVGPTCVLFAEISHAALIPSGPYQGQVLMWREPDDPICFPQYTGEAWIFDPANPSSLVRLEQTLQSNIFCGAASWDPQSELVICGGDRNSTGYYGKKTYRFRPLTLGSKVTDSAHPSCTPTAQRIAPGARAPFLTLGNTL